MVRVPLPVPNFQMVMVPLPFEISLTIMVNGTILESTIKGHMPSPGRGGMGAAAALPKKCLPQKNEKNDRRAGGG